MPLPSGAFQLKSNWPGWAGLGDVALFAFSGYVSQESRLEIFGMSSGIG
ncbi:MAG: hypothetical protein O3A00_08940 [Planctomycetota bacterium]|nr:hypothetical protein [Planctomycetota bacterium]